MRRIRAVPGRHRVVFAVLAVTLVLGCAGDVVDAPDTEATTEAALEVTGTANSELIATVTASIAAKLQASVDATREALPTPVPSVYDGLLGNIPDTPETRADLWVNNYALAAELANVDVPSRRASSEEVFDYFRAIGGAPPAQLAMGPGPFISGFGDYAVQFLEYTQYRGFDLRDINVSLMAGQPPAMSEVVSGSFDPEVFYQGINCDECAPYEFLETQGILFYSWSRDNRPDLGNRHRPPLHDQFGRGGNVLIDEKVVLRTVGVEEMEGMIVAREGGTRSLADNETFVELVRAMEGLESYSFHVTDLLLEKSPEIYVAQGGYGITDKQWDD